MAGTGDESETLLGEYFASRKCRDRVILATKAGFDRHNKGQELTKQIEYWIDESLRKLQTDHIDLYYAHTDAPTTPLASKVTVSPGDRISKMNTIKITQYRLQ